MKANYVEDGAKLCQEFANKYGYTLSEICNTMIIVGPDNTPQREDFTRLLYRCDNLFSAYNNDDDRSLPN